MKKGYLWILLSAAILLAVGIGATVAYLTSSSGTVKNTFTVGQVAIELTESTVGPYHLTPGVAEEKDPTVTVLGGSEASWLFVKIEKSENFDEFCSYETAEGWTHLAGYGEVYYRTTASQGKSQSFSVLMEDCVKVRGEVTEEELRHVTENPVLTFTAYAVQQSGYETPHSAWEAMMRADDQ